MWRRLSRNDEFKRRLYIIIFESDTPLGKAFDVALLWAILLSIVLIMVESIPAIPDWMSSFLVIWEYIFTGFFTIEYIARIYCSPDPRKYITSFFGIIDLLSTMPFYLGLFFSASRYLMVLRTFRLIRVFRVFKLFSFLEEGDKLLKSLKLSFPKIMVFFLFVVIMVISLGTMMYMVEGSQPGTPFTDVPTSIYWAVVTMTTVGYGDIVPVTLIGRILSAVVMLLGYTIIAVPTGIVSAQFSRDIRGGSGDGKAKCKECGSTLPDSAHYCPFCGNEVE
ncbi:MAG: ion transporter [Bacteroidaceae bacterium]|nr:ion transporter [Bacteroidaceae bacterium]